MNRWQATVEIAKAFIERGNPGYAFATVSLIVVSATGGAVLVALKLAGH
jgi:hypothetical protein